MYIVVLKESVVKLQREYCSVLMLLARGSSLAIDVCSHSVSFSAWKTIKQVEGGGGLKALANKGKFVFDSRARCETICTKEILICVYVCFSVKVYGPSKLYHGSLAAFGATWVGEFLCN